MYLHGALLPLHETIYIVIAGNPGQDWPMPARVANQNTGFPSSARLRIQPDNDISHYIKAHAVPQTIYNNYLLSSFRNREVRCTTISWKEGQKNALNGI